jgi:hypothetical protein
MRQLFMVTCAVALASCSESKTPTAIQSPPTHTTPADSVAHPPTPAPGGVVDTRPAAQRIEAAMTESLRKVRLPPDEFSLSADAVHPDIACPPDNWNSSRCWLIYTPYLNSDNAYENPAFLFAANDTAWNTPNGVLNPIIPYPGSGSYNSDPDHAFDPIGHRLVQVYRVVSGGSNSIMIMSTANARQWTLPSLAFREPSHDAVSPSLVIGSDRTAKIWYVSAGGEGCQSKTTSVRLRTAQPDAQNSYEQSLWSPPIAVDMGLPDALVWHLDVTPLDDGKGYIALIAAYPKGSSCGNSDLWLATSADGLHWRTYAIPILWRSMKFAMDRDLTTWYRGTLRYDADSDMLHLWPSALVGSSWTIYHAALPLHDLLESLDMTRSSDLRALRTMLPSRAPTSRAIEMP